MVQNPDSGKSNLPKDTTPNPMDAISGETKPAATSASAPIETSHIIATHVEQPKDAKSFLKEIFIESPWTNRIYQFIILLFGLYSIYLSIKGQIFLPLPAVFGMLLLSLVALFDVYFIKKFRQKYEKLEIIIRFVLAGLFVLFMIIFIIELFKPFDITVNKNLLLVCLIAVLVVFIVNFLLYIKTNKEKIIADVYMFIAILFAVISIIVFYQYQVILSFFLMLISGSSIIASINNDPLKKDDRFPTRMLIILLTAIMFTAVFAYASLIFTNQPLKVITFGTISDNFSKKPENLSWSGDSWSFAYNIFNKKKKENKIGIINALSLGITELPADNSDIKLPKFVDKPIWNNNGTKLIFTCSDSKDGYKKIWGINLNLSLVKENKKKGKKEKEKKLRTKEDDILNRPVGKPKVLLSDINLIVDKDCQPLIHRTVWSPDGNRFVFAAKDDDSDSNNIWVANTKTQEYNKITKGQNKIMPLWSPAEDKILYVTKTDSYTYLKITNYDGSNPHELNINNKSDRSLFPLWNANESKVIYIKNNKLIIMNANATNQQELTKQTLVYSDYWLTDTKKKVKLTFTESGTIWRIFTIDSEGNNPKEIFTEVCDSMIQPKWSYDGEVICAGTNYVNYSTLWRLNKDGEMKIKLFTTKHKIKNIEWDPSSKRIAFLLEKNIKDNIWYNEPHEKIYQIWVVERDGTNPRFIYESIGIINNITWDDMGKNIAFDETYSRWYFAPKITTVKVANVIDNKVKYLLPYESYAEYPSWSYDGQVLAYVSWSEFWRPTLSKKIWIAQVK
ncbi:MAG: hypothetical protein N2114_05450 [Candidatus Goldbacteria bacterium]|nr:hypothetical protein [Candidatus Goldiibacteriota bacterium]